MPGLPRTTGRAKLLLLHSVAPAETARRAKALWSQLSLGCHYHLYELGPTYDQVRVWRVEAAWSRSGTRQLIVRHRPFSDSCFTGYGHMPVAVSPGTAGRTHMSTTTRDETLMRRAAGGGPRIRLLHDETG